MVAALSHLHLARGQVLSNLRPLGGALQEIGGPELLPQALVADDVVVQAFANDVFSGQAVPAAASRPAAGTVLDQDRVPVADDYESALLAGLQMARAVLQSEQDGGEASMDG